MNQITEQSQKAYQIELEELYNSMAELEQVLNEAKAEGDLKENASYDAAKERITIASNRISELEDILQTSKVAKDSGGPEITIGSYFRVYELDENNLPINEGRLFLLDSVERYLDGFIGIHSPLGEKIYQDTSGVYPITTTYGKKVLYRVEKVLDNPEEEFEELYKNGSKIFE